MYTECVAVTRWTELLNVYLGSLVYLAMQATATFSITFLALAFAFALACSVDALPLSFPSSNYACAIGSSSSSFSSGPDSQSTTPRIACTTLPTHTFCMKFHSPVDRPRTRTCPPPSSSPQAQFSSTIIGTGKLASAEDAQILRIMDGSGSSVMTEAHNQGKMHQQQRQKGEEWVLPDVQVVMWFVLLCCLAEGASKGFQW